jgi:hypothetical protein
MVGERFANASKHEGTEEVRQLQQQTEARKEGADTICEALQVYLKTLGTFLNTIVKTISKP